MSDSPPIMYITQDDHGLWMVSVEDQLGFYVKAWGFEDPDHVIGEGYNPQEWNLPDDTIVKISDPEAPMEEPRSLSKAAAEYEKPEPRRAGERGEPVILVQHGKRVKEATGGE